MGVKVRLNDVLIGYCTNVAPTITPGSTDKTQTLDGSVNNPRGDKTVEITISYVDMAISDSYRNKNSSSSQEIFEELDRLMATNNGTLTLLEDQTDAQGVSTSAANDGVNTAAKRSIFTNCSCTNYNPTIDPSSPTTIALTISATEAKISYT